MPNVRHAPWLVLVAMGFLGFAAWAAGIPGGTAPASSKSRDPDAEAETRGRDKHYVTPRQLVDSNAMVGQSPRGLEATDHLNRRVTWAELSGGRPVVLVFVKNGCPCNVEFEPFVRRVERLYGDAVRFAGVIDAGAETARRYALELRVTHPVLADPDREIIKRFRAENGGYIALLTPDGVIDGFWPGCSADGMKELGHRLARLAGTAERPLEVTGMPGPLTTGCPFEH